MRSVVHLTIGGGLLRIRLSNLYGRAPLTIDATRVTASDKKREVEFGGQLGVTIPPGASVVSDPVDIGTFAGMNVEITELFSIPTPMDITYHVMQSAERNIFTGRKFASERLTVSKPVPYTYFLAGVDVKNKDSHGTIVALGDSITDGGEHMWPALLARRLLAQGKSYGVVNAGIAGNRLLRDGIGPCLRVFGSTARSRFARDVLDQPNVKYVVIYEGINDIGLSQSALGNWPVPSAEEVIAEMEGLARLAHQHGLKIYLATLAPFAGADIAGYYTPQKNMIRTEINAWIRSTKSIDGYFDFEAAIKDASNPDRLNPKFDSGDHLHPNESGEQALSESIDLASFE